MLDDSPSLEAPGTDFGDRVMKESRELVGAGEDVDLVLKREKDLHLEPLRVSPLSTVDSRSSSQTLSQATSLALPRRRH